MEEIIDAAKKANIHEFIMSLPDGYDSFVGERGTRLSGGQKQRVAIARAMANDPAIILADEPTGALDSSTGRLVMDLFHKLHREQGKTIVLITHNQELAEETQRIVTIRDGQVVDVRAGSQVLPEESIYCHGNSAATGEGGSV